MNMNTKVVLAAIAVLAMAERAQAVTLVVMATNTTAVAGAKVFDVGVRISAADVAVGGPNPVLLVQNISFTGSVNGPVQASAANNKQDLQSVWNTLDTLNGGGGPSFPTSGNGTTQLYKDSWWYAGSTGTLQGIVDAEGNPGVVTTVPASDGSGVYAQGPGALVGQTGYLFSPQATGITGGATNNSTMVFTGLFGPLGANYLDPSPGGPFTDPHHILGDLLVQNGGVLNVPLAQVIAKGDIAVPSTPGGAGTFIEIGTPIYNVLGGPQSVDPQAEICFHYNGFVLGCPEPSGWLMGLLAGLGATVWLLRRRQSSERLA